MTCSISDLTVTCPIPCPHSQAPRGLPRLPFCFLHLEWPHSQRLGPGPFLFSFCAFSGNISLALMSAIVSDYSLCSNCSSSSRPSGLRLEILTWGLSDPLSAASKFINLDSHPPPLTHLISPLTRVSSSSQPLSHRFQSVRFTERALAPTPSSPMAQAAALLLLWYMGLLDKLLFVSK